MNKYLNIFETKKKESKNISYKEIKIFFEVFESNDFEYIEDNSYEYDENIYENYDDGLIKILKTFPENNKEINKFVLDKIKYYNDYLENLDLDNIYKKTIKYLKNPNIFFTNDDIVKLFIDDYNNAIIEFNKIDNFKDCIKIYNRIDNINKNDLFINKIDNYLLTNLIDDDLHKCLNLVLCELTNEENIKKYGLISLQYKPNFNIFNKIKPLCNKDELDVILNNILKLKYLNDDIFNILYDYKLIDILYNLFNKKSYHSHEIIKYCSILIIDIPEKINTLLKSYVEQILNEQHLSYYSYTIEYLKIYQKHNSNADFLQYTNNLLMIHKKKSKFKKLFNEEFMSMYNEKI
jgi:hypothetical protein